MGSNRPEHIEKLLEKYWNCDSTLEEEQELKNWFSSHSSSDKLGEEEALFKYFALEKKKEIHSESFDDELFKSINSYKDRKNKRFFLKPWFGNISKIAAGIIVALAATLYVIYEEEPEVPAVFMTDTFETPEEAYEETLKVLQLISQKLNVGKEHASKISILSEAEEAVKEKESTVN